MRARLGRVQGAALQCRLKKLINRPDIPRGVYMYGGVGRGKSFLMDCFFSAVPIVRKTRLHFHEFMREVHRELADLQGTVNPLDELGARMARKYRLICFDEFHVADITDAMILHRLLSAMFDRASALSPHPTSGRTICIRTACTAPAPAGDRVAQGAEARSDPIGTGTDYRRRAWSRCKLYHVPLGPEADAADGAGVRPAGRDADEDPVLHIEQRQIRARRRPAAWCGSTSRPCAAGHARRTTTWRSRRSFTPCCSVDVPFMPVRMASEARRFTWLVDVLYDRRVKLILSAEVQPEALYTEGPLAHEFVRTASRLSEMQSAEYLALERRSVDTRLT
jgi:cell division protein ZapE